MFGFKKIDRTNIGKFKKNYLKNVILHIRFENDFELEKNIAKFKEVFKYEFPRFRERSAHSLGVTFSDDETPVVQPLTKKSNGFELRSESGNKLLSCTSNAITLNIAGAEYKNFEELDSFLNNLNKILKSCDLEKVSRISIRKINIIDFNIPKEEEVSPYELMEYVLNNDLIGKSDLIPSSSLIKQSIQNLNFQDGKHRLILRYGMVVHPTQERQGQILIDIDGINESLITINEIKNELNLINNEIFNIFNWCLSETAYNQLLNEE